VAAFVRKGGRFAPEHAVEGAVGIFGGDQNHKEKDDASLIAQLYQQIGQLKVERDFLESSLGR